jgi:hypothetical protein
MVVGLSTAQAADDSLTLACQGTASMITDTTDYGDSDALLRSLRADLLVARDQAIP